MAIVTNSVIAQICYTIFMLAGSFDSISFYKATQFVAGPFASVIMTWFSLLNSLMILILPIVVTTIAKNNEYSEWAIIFYVVAGIIVVTTIIYQITSDIKPRPWVT
uniref:Uncharacterized protein n=1 Tax=Panagrolaimus davidi TaxID=227884 RepID=A0A914PZS1_9BILA